MSTVVADIRTGIESRVSTSLGATYQKLRRFYDPEQNDFRAVKKGYAVVQLGAIDASTEGTFKHYTLDQQFDVLLTNTFSDRGDDADIQTAIEVLYDEADKLLVDFLGTGLNTISVTDGMVLTTNQPGLSEPEILANSAVLLRVSFNVKYRRQFT